MLRRRWSATLVLCALVLGACGGEPGDETAPTIPATSATTAPAAEASPGQAALLQSIPPVQRLGAPSPPGTFVGRVAGTDALIAILRNDAGDAVAYVCDGKRIASWLSGRRGPTGLELGNRTRTVNLRASEQAGGLRGSLTLEDGSTHDFTAAPAATGRRAFHRTAGEAAGAPFQVGWILFDGELRGARTSPATAEPRQEVSHSRADASPTATRGTTSTSPTPTRGRPADVCIDLREQINLVTPSIENIRGELSRTTDPVVRADLQNLIDQATDLLEQIQLEVERLACD